MTVLLSVSQLHKSYGGVRATDDLNLDVQTGELHAVIGPNGAGKTTLISQLSGNVFPDSGTISFDGNDITHMMEHARPHLGIARTYQITSLINSMSVIGNLQLAIQAKQGHSFKFWKPYADNKDVRTAAYDCAARVDLGTRAEIEVANLSHGEQRRLEVAMALASDARLLLLDEPLAGLGPEEASDMISLLETLKGQQTIVLIEHDMDAVFTLADRISVMVYGHIIATGYPDHIRQNQDVQHAYLGED
ncbi:MAG: ABC transporter ATP-binding protein [Paracoccaceae bacterium]